MFPVRSTDLKGDVQRGKIEPREPQHRAAPAELPQSGPHMRAKPCHSPGNTTQCMKPQGHPDHGGAAKETISSIAEILCPTLDYVGFVAVILKNIQGLKKI